MGKEVLRFRGLTLNRDEQSADKGELSLCAGVELHDGALRASVLEGSDVENKLVRDWIELSSISVPDEKTVTLLYVHETASYRHYIGVLDNALYWFTEDGVVGGKTNVCIVTYETVQTLNNSNLIPDDTIVETVIVDNVTMYKLTFAVPTFAEPIKRLDANDSVISINSVGNTLVVMTKTNVHYILWKDGSYKYLGTNIPFVEFCFRPTENYKGAYDRSTIENEDYEAETTASWRQLDIDPGDIFSINNDENKVYINGSMRSTMTDAVWATINQANDTIAKDGHFYAPFLIRYCYRLYDGSMVMHSAPVFMNVSLPQNYRVYTLNIQRLKSATEHSTLPSGIETTSPPDASVGEMYLRRGQFDIYDAEGHVFHAHNTVLHYTPNNVGIEYSLYEGDGNAQRMADLKSDWTDIVKSIDVFVSPMMTREQSGKLIGKFIPQQEEHFGIRHRDLKIFDNSEWNSEIWSEFTRHESVYVQITYYVQYISECKCMAEIPMMSKDEYLQKLKDCSTFYKLMSFNLETDSIPVDGEYHILNYDKTIVPNITSQELMKDDYHTHCDLLPIGNNGGMYVYNHRVNLYGMKEKLFEGFNIQTMINDYFTGTKQNILEIAVELNTDEGKKCVVRNCYNHDYPPTALCNALLFYPDSRASKMTVYLSNNTAIELKMEPCNFLNGAMATQWFYNRSLPSAISATRKTVDDEVPMLNKVLTSEVDNPYYFPLEGRNTVGIGNIRGIAAVTRALSQGQVGDHDLVVFSTDGIWVMKVSKEGTYSATHNISREVCTNPKSICQLDQSVVFATERSLSRFVESNVVSMSDMLDGPIPNWSELLPTLVANFPDADHQGTVQQQIINKLLEKGTPAVTLFNQGKVFYDYASSRVVVLPDGEPSGTEVQQVALVFSTRDQTWSTMVVPKILAVVPGYPSPFVELGDGTVKILDKTYDYSADNSYPGLIITRELTFSDTMDVIQGFKQYADSAVTPKIWLYGSNDQRTWQPIGNTQRWYRNYLPGRPYRFFRIAVYMEMKQSEEYQQLLLEVVNKYAKL